MPPPQAKRHTFRGESRTLGEWAATPDVAALGLNANAIYMRLKKGWSLEDALTRPKADPHAPRPARRGPKRAPAPAYMAPERARPATPVEAPCAPTKPVRVSAVARVLIDRSAPVEHLRDAALELLGRRLVTVDELRALATEFEERAIALHETAKRFEVTGS